MSEHESRTKLSRRRLLQVAAGSAALVALPAWSAANAASAKTTLRESASVGWWLGGRDANPAHLRAGWREACASSQRHACAAPLHDELVDASGLRGEAGSYRVRAIDVANQAALVSVRLVAQYGAAVHEMWSAWRGGASSPVAARMASIDGSALPFSIHDADGSVRDVALPARAGAYVLALAPGRVAWRRWELVARDASRPLAREVALRGAGARMSAPYLLLAVERLA